jgi:Arylsulfotransferase (ASST)
VRRPSKRLALLPGSISLVVLAGLVTLSPAHLLGGTPSSSPSCVPTRLNISAGLAGKRVTVSPEPDSMDASATTQISMLGANAGELADVTVTGSRTGAHSGRLAPYSQGDGASFVPSHPFAGGELVSVRAKLLDGSLAIPFAWNFTVAVRDQRGAKSTAVGAVKSANTTSSSPPAEYQGFHSRPELRPPQVTVSREQRTATGDFFLAPYSGNGQYGPMVLDEHGGLIWFKALAPRGTRAANLQVQRYEGRPVLTWWQDPLVADGSRTAGDVIANSSYQTVAIVRAGNGYQPDLHEFHITPQGTALITVYDAIECNLASVGGSRNAAVADTLLQEIDLKTGLVMYEWHSLDHVPLSSSYLTAGPASRSEPFDYFHINSVDAQQDGDLLIGSRDTWAAYDIDRRTGAVRWELGGKRSSFKLGAGTATAWQHDAIEQPNGAITFFDNGASPQEHRQSRAIEVALNTHAMTATLLRSYDHGHPLVSGSQGNLQALANGDWVVGWGQAGYLSEVNPAGQVLFDARLPRGWESYRTFVLPWSGHPSTAPALAAEAEPGGSSTATAYASWNGATEVSSWRVLAGSSPASLKPAASAARSGFETAIPVAHAPPGAYLAVQALSSTDAVLATSPTVAVKPAP